MNYGILTTRADQLAGLTWMACENCLEREQLYALPETVSAALKVCAHSCYTYLAKNQVTNIDAQCVLFDCIMDCNTCVHELEMFKSNEHVNAASVLCKEAQAEMTQVYLRSLTN